MALYGMAQDDFKSVFLAKLVRACLENPLPTLLGRDFNVMCNNREKNNDRFNNACPLLFNIVIGSFNLTQIYLTGRQFTWANTLPNPTYEKLDQVLMTTECELK